MRRKAERSLLALGVSVFASLACSSQGSDTEANGSGASSSQGGAGASASAGQPGAGASAGGAGASGSAGSANAGAGGASGAHTLPASCSEAATPYVLSLVELDASLTPFVDADGWNGELRAALPVAVNEQGQVFVGFTRETETGYGAAIASPGSESAIAAADDAALAGVAVTQDGLGALLFDPNPNVDERRWAAVTHFVNGSAEYQTDLFRSDNLVDVGTKGAPDTSRLAHAGGNELIAYFGHTERSDDNVRHQGGYLASVADGGAATELSGWFGSHNLNQRLLETEQGTAQLGLGDAYPKGIFFSFTSAPDTHVIYKVAADSQGTANAQLGGIVDLGDALVAPFITNQSISQELNPGTWPDIDQGIADQIRAAAHQGTDLGLLEIVNGQALPDGDLSPVWIDTGLADGGRLHNLKSARYGSALILLAWQESSGEGDAASTSYYTMVVDRDGNVCQPKTVLDPSYAFLSGDDMVQAPDGKIVWANVLDGRMRVLTLTP